MNDCIRNARRALRLPLRCAAWIEADGAGRDGHTEDLGARGCRLAAPVSLASGSSVRLALRCDGAAGILSAGAKVVWSGRGPPWLHGIAFDEPDRPRAELWFDELAGRHAELLLLDRVPDRLQLAARVYVGPAPAAAPRLGDEEVLVLQLACGRPTLGHLRAVLGADWSRAERALFSLLGRGTVTLDAAEAGDPRAWRPHLEAAQSAGRRWS